jgi:feruloyl esterase
MCILSLPIAWAQQSVIGDDACTKLASLSLPTTKIVSAQIVAAGTFAPPGSPQLIPADKALYAGLPSFCRVVVMDTPAADSAIPIEVWMPVKGWNGKFRGQGNGGFAGSVDYVGLGVAVNFGYASAGTDTGHVGSPENATWAIGHPEKVIDFGYRAIHEMTLKAKAIVEAYYAEPAKRNYFSGCSDGGREALMEAQRFPEDYDGIISGAPSAYLTHTLTNFLYNSQALTLDPASYIPSAKIPAIAAAVLADCDAADGVADGVLNDPRSCHFKPATLLCKGPETDVCLTSKQAHTLEVLYAGSHDSKGKPIFPGYLPGSELGQNGWGPWVTGPAPGQSIISVYTVAYFANMVYEKPDWEYKKADIDNALKTATEKTAHALDAADPDLKPFAARGGKLILYHGWNDPAYSALSSINYYNDVRKVTGPRETDSFVRLFVVPGMQHCGFGPGAWYFDQRGLPPAALLDDAQHDINLALEAWVEKGVVPDSMIAAKFPEKLPLEQVLMTRPICAYPSVTKYKGSGDTSDAANFRCGSKAK